MLLDQGLDAVIAVRDGLDHLVELLMMLDIARSAAASEVHAIIPYYSFARSDKKDAPRISITARLVADQVQPGKRYGYQLRINGAPVTRTGVDAPPPTLDAGANASEKANLPGGSSRAGW